MAFLLDNLKEKFGDEEDEEPNFGGLDYRIGTTTGKDVGQEPSFLARRAGRFAQFGGSTLEILVEDAGTFEVDREEIMDTVSNLGLETVSFHGNPNIGFSSPALQRHDSTRSYFTEYLHGFGGLIRAIGENDRYDFDISYVNMHASVNPLPQIQSERQPGGIDIFGKETTNIDGGKQPNIYTNKEFLKTLFDLLRLQDDRDMERQIYTGVIASDCNAFEEDWKRARQFVLNEMYDELGYSPQEEDLQREASLIATAGRGAEGALFEFQDLLEEKFEDEELVRILSQGQLSLIPQKLIQIKRGDEYDYDEEFRRKLHETFRDLWKGEKADIEDSDSEELGLTVESKQAAIQRAEDIDQRTLQTRVNKRAAQKDIDGSGGQNPHELARRAFSGDRDYYEEDYIDDIEGRPSYLNIVENMQRAYNTFQTQSGVIYYLIPAWLNSASFESDETDDQALLGEGNGKVHEGWSVGEFIWESLVSGRGDKSYPSIEDADSYIDKLRSSAEFRQDVGAAAGAGYMWGHFTQIESYFKPEREDQYRGETESTLRTGGNEMKATWMEWLEQHDVRVNMESMVNSLPEPGQYYLLWRPKDIAVACHATNIEARRQGVEPPLKFTIDMEHTASFGVDPEQEMELMIQNEERLASNPDLDIDEDAPLKNILETYHLTRPGFEVRQGHMHGEIRRGDKMVYRYLYRLVENGFCRGDDTCTIAFEVAGNYSEDIYNARVIMDLIELNVRPEDLRADRVDASGDYDTREEALMARFFNMDEATVEREFAAIEQNAFNPLKELLEAEDFENTQLGNTALDNNVRPQQFTKEEFR
ncbi:hypothetical protein GLU01_01120 [Nanohaloarchaea archaeon]|nr:hypothetical protein [Candidatus Nanohaloarchaea archaeon]